MSTRHSSHLYDRFRAYGLNHSLAIALRREVSRWVSENGPEWTVKRLKLIKTNFIRGLASLDSDWVGVAVRRNSGTGVVIPKGPFGCLWKSTSTFKSRVRALNALMVYTTFKSRAVTREQWKKFQSSVERIPTDPASVEKVRSMLHIPRWMRVREEKPTSFLEFVTTKGYTPSYVAAHMSNFLDTDVAQVVWDKYPIYREVMGPYADRITSRFSFDDYFGYHEPLTWASCRDAVGTLGVTQEPGFKLRVFASPNLVHQCALLRMKQQLFDLLRRVKWDCTYDQSMGIEWAQEQLTQGKLLYSVDLSDATNNFPLDLQLHLLREVGCREEDVSLFCDLSRSAWQPTHERGAKALRWTQGQPLGLGPSFAAFALTHGVLVHSVARLLGLETDSFRVLGDDIVIAGAELGEAYVSTLQEIGVPVARDKTLVSYTIAEFAGKVISKEGPITAAKWRDPSDNSFMDFVRNAGPGVVNLLPPRQRKVVEYLGPLPEPHGFGWNPRGIPLDARIQVILLLDELKPTRSVRFANVETSARELDNMWRERYLHPNFGRQFDSLAASLYRDVSERTQRSYGAKSGPSRPEMDFTVGPVLLAARSAHSKVTVPRDLVTPQARRFLRRFGYIPVNLDKDLHSKSERTTLENLELKIGKVRTPAAEVGYSPT